MAFLKAASVGFVLMTLFSTPLWAEERRVVISQDAQDVLVEDLKGVVFLSESSDIPFANRDQSGGIWIEKGLSLPGSDEDLLRAVRPFLNKPLTMEGLVHLREAVSQYYADHNHPVVSVIVPPQDITDGRLKLRILEGKVGEVAVRGNRWTSDRFILKGMDLKKGDKLDSYKLQNDLAWLNRYPFRRTDAFLTPGKDKESTNVELVTVERFPFRPYAGGDNTGTAFTERTRWYTGFNAGNLWGLNHTASYQFTTSQNATSFLAHTANYTAPLPWKHTLLAYGGWARLKGNLPASFKNQGMSWQTSGRYQIPISPLFGNFLQEIDVGYDFKQTNNTLQFGGIRVSKKRADINQFSATYMLDFRTDHSKTSFIADLVAAPWDLTKHQNNTDFFAIRPFAKARYGYGKGRLSHTYFLPYECTIKGVIAGQGTAWNLLPSEMFGLGGYDTVRGYDERAFNADNGLLSSVEFFAPPIHFWHVKTGGKLKDLLEFLAFADWGWGGLHRHVPGQKKTQWLMGIGPGVRYSFMTNVYLRADVGFPLHRAGSGRHGIHAHVGGTVNY